MTWNYDPSEPHLTPERFFEHYCQREGLTPEQARLPEVLVATFQGAAAQRLIERTNAGDPHDINHTVRGGHGIGNRMLVGRTPGEETPVAVTRLPVGAPATALILETAFCRGVRTVLVCGSAGSLLDTLPLGSVVVVSRAEREDGTSHHYLPGDQTTEADPGLVTALHQAATRRALAPSIGRTWTTDAPFRETAGAIARHRSNGVAVVDMEASALFAVARVRGGRAGLIVTISDELFLPWNPGFHLPIYRDALVQTADAVLDAADELT